MASPQSIPGGWTKRDPNDKTIVELAKKAAQQMWPDRVFERVVDAYSQVVDGTNYRIDILLSKTKNDRVHVKYEVHILEPLPAQ
ncbi:hypothetical protein DPMN_037967 [Dreissena polymorpha]|uniref:Cystatin domain-containing protein n=1 Tax=Dreissena polymorpha TaxID=45954 RepID=A0A9D4MEJ2_DREPO|nr:hypothetical protein DPMN_037967 [Dreissena polymorpha]